MEIRRFIERDAAKIAVLHRNTVRESNAKDYSPEQIAAWTAISPTKWAVAFEKTICYVAAEGERIIGFGDFDKKGYICDLYTDPDYQGRGAGSGILSKLEEEARSRDIRQMTLCATITAYEFYRRRGFVNLGRIPVLVNRVQVVGYYMTKELDASVRQSAPGLL